MGIKFSNNASANITQALSSTSTSVSVSTGKGNLFPSLVEGDYFYATLAGNNGLEIVKVISRINDTMTIVRAQDNTTALSFSSGDLFELRIVAADFEDTLTEVNTSLNETITSVNNTLDTTVESINDTINTTVTNVNNSLASTESTLNSSMSELRTEYTEAITALQNKHDEDLNNVFNQLDKIEVFPSQTDHSGEFLTTDGTSVSWWPIAQDILDAAEEASSSSEGTSDFYEPLIGTVAHEMGSWWISLDNSIPTGGLPHLGHLCSRATYGDFWTWCELNKIVVSEEDWLAYANAHNGCCPYYSYGDGSTTFRTPSYDQSFLKVLASIGDTGKMEEAGLPNIKGTLSGYDLTGPETGTSSGVLYVDSSTTTTYGASVAGDYTSQLVGFDASLASSVYSDDCDTVTPQNFGIIVGVYAVGAVSAPIGETDAASLLSGITALEKKVSSNTTALSRISIVRSGAYADGSQWYRQYADGWLELGGTTTSDTVDFLRPFKDTNYTVTCTPYNADTNMSKTGHFFAVTKTPNGMTRTYSTIQVDWMARGYGEV